MEATNMAWPPDERPHYERTLSLLADVLPPQELAVFRARGAAFTGKEAIDFALERS